MTGVTLELQPRAGAKPETTKPSRERRLPHQQISQNAPVELQEELFERARRLPGVVVGESLVSVPGARAFHLEPSYARGPAQAFQAEREFAHIHPAYDGSLHLTLPPEEFREVERKGWGESHPVSGTMMVWGPRDGRELETVWDILKASYRYATGSDDGRR